MFPLITWTIKVRRQKYTIMEWQKGATNIGPVLMPYMYGICVVPFVLFAKSLVKNTFFKSASKKMVKWWISNVPIWIWSEEATQSVDFMDSRSLVRFFPKKTQNLFLDSEIRIWMFPKDAPYAGSPMINFFGTSSACYYLNFIILRNNILNFSWFAALVYR